MGSLFSSEWVTLKTYGFLFFVRMGNAENVWVQLFLSEWVTLKTYRFLFFVRQGRGVLHTPSLTFPPRGRTSVPGYTDRHPKATARPRQFLFFVRMGRGVSHTPSLTSPPRGRTQDMYSPPSVASGGRIRYAPTTGYINRTKKHHSLPSMTGI